MKKPKTLAQRRSAARTKEIVKLSRTMAQADIARMYGLSRQRIHYILNRERDSSH